VTEGFIQAMPYKQNKVRRGIGIGKNYKPKSVNDNLVEQFFTIPQVQEIIISPVL